jgi:sedoheptulokinase
MSKYLGIDIGTSKIAFVLYQSDENKILKSISIPHKAVYKKNEISEIDIHKIKNISFEFLKNLKEKKEIKGIGISTQMHGCLVVDKNLNPITPLITWEDKRTLLPYKNGKNYIEYIKEISGEKLKNTGTIISPGFMGPTIFYLKETLPSFFKSGYKMCFIGDYLSSLLTGEEIKTDITNAGSSGFFDILHKNWLWDVIEKLHIPEYIFPQIVETGEISGKINKKILKNTGINRNCNVGVSIGDNQASIIGCSGYLKNKIVINIGTGSQISKRIETYKKFPFTDTRYFIKDKYISVGAGLSGGKTLKILEHFLKDTGKKIFEIKNIKNIFEKIHKYSEKALSDNQIIAGTFFSGSRQIPDLKGFLLNLTEDNFNIENLLFSFYAGIIFELYFYYGLMEKTEINEIIGSGNGFRKNPLLGKISASLFNIPVSISKTKEEAATGACLVIAEKMEHIDIEKFIEKNIERNIFLPNKNLEYLKELYEIYNNLLTS